MVLVRHMELVYFPVNTIGVTPFPLEAGFSGGDTLVVGAFAYDVNAFALTPEGIQLVSQTDAQALTVTLAEGDKQIVADVPYRDFQRDQNGGIWLATEPFRIDLSKSYVRANTGITASRAVAIAFAFIQG